MTWPGKYADQGLVSTGRDGQFLRPFPLFLLLPVESEPSRARRVRADRNGGLAKGKTRIGKVST